MGDDITQTVTGLVHEETQVRDDGGVDLTVTEVYEVETPGRVDFGGGELEAASLAPVETERRDPDDDYGWWNLEGGQYLVEYNEGLTGGRRVEVQTRDELLARGASHPTLRVDTLGRMPLAVPRGGLRLKENARVSTVRAAPGSADD